MILVKSLGFAHGGLDVETLDILPVLLEQRHEEVHGQTDVLHQLVIRHLNVAHGNVQAEDLLHLELDGGLEDIHFLLEVICVCHHSGELASLRWTTYICHQDTLIVHDYTLLRPGPRSLGICLIRVSEQRNAS